MNELITNLFNDFVVCEKVIPVKFLYYNGHGEPYVVWQQVDADGSYAGDDDLLGYVSYYDFDVYAKGNYMELIESLMQTLKGAGFVWQLSRSSEDMFEVETGYYHKTMCFAYLKQEEENG